ncbi:MAG: hypothetical protein JW934_15250 [Anaerolineae bacterium]|nr:hypothetical protein [Anaerolineae bacterium]
MTTWVIPYIDQDIAFWQEIADRFGAHIKEVYFPMPGGMVSSGRPPQPDCYMGAFLQSALLSKNVLLNPILLSQPAEQVAPGAVDALKRLQADFGVTRTTVTNLTLARLIREALPDFTITASVLMGIVRPAQVVMIQDYVDAITVDNSLVRDLDGLQRLRDAFKGEIRIIVNEACIPGCPYRVQHFYEMGYGNSFPRSLCEQMLARHPWLRLTGAWVLPHHLSYYDGLYDSLKLAGRVTLRDPSRYVTVLKAYIGRERILPCDIGGGPASVLDAMDMPDDLFEYILHCDKHCHACSICQDYYRKAHVQKGV